MGKIKAWFKENKEELMFSWAVLGTVTTVFLATFLVLMTAITNDLVGVVETKNVELAEANEKAGAAQFREVYYKGLYEETVLTYENSVPRVKYNEDVIFLEQHILYLESVIEELIYQCEQQCETYNNKEC